MKEKLFSFTEIQVLTSLQGQICEIKLMTSLLNKYLFQIIKKKGEKDCI